MFLDGMASFRRSVLLLVFLLTWFTSGYAALNGLGLLFTTGGFTAVQLFTQITFGLLAIVLFWLWKYLAKNYPPRDGVILVAIMLIFNFFAVIIGNMPTLLYAVTFVIAPVLGVSPAEVWMN